MATFTDVLRTAFDVLGAAQYLKVLDQAAKGAQNVADADKVRKERASQLKEGLGELGIEHALLAGKMGAVGFLLNESIKNFREDEDAIFRTTVLLRNLGNSYPIETAKAFADAQEVSTGFAGEQILEVEALLKRFGAADNTIQDLTKTVLDFSAATGLSLEHAATAVGHALVGNTRILRNMGIEFKATGDRAKDLAALQEKLNSLFGGAAEARVNALTGAFDQLKQALSGFFSVVGDKLSTVLVPALKAVTALLQLISQNATLATTLFGAALGAILGGAPGALIGAVAGLGLGLLPSRPNAAERVGNGQERIATEGTLREVAENTKQINNTLIQRVLGGPGQVAGRAITLRDTQLAFGI